MPRKKAAPELSPPVPSKKLKTAEQPATSRRRLQSKDENQVEPPRVTRATRSAVKEPVVEEVEFIPTRSWCVLNKTRLILGLLVASAYAVNSL